MLTPREQRQLVRLARQGLDARVRKLAPPAMPSGGALDIPYGVFVSVHAYGELRGCLGRIERDLPLAEAVLHLASAVSECDPRFPPIGERELLDVTIEISVLTPMHDAASPDHVEVGRHGVVVQDGHRCGLLLPRVAIDHGWDAPTLVAHACLKAGLPERAWQTGARLQVFEALVFGEV